MLKRLAQNQRGIVGFVILVTFAFPLAAFCQKASIQDVLIKRTNGAWKVGFSVENCFTAKMEETIQSGISTTFTFYLDFYQKRSWWKDRKMASVEFHHTLQYDPIQAEYRVALEENGSTVGTSAFGEAKGLMAKVDGVQIDPSQPLDPKLPTYVRIKAELNRVRLPLHLESLLFFVSLWDFETAWYVESIKP